MEESNAQIRVTVTYLFGIRISTYGNEFDSLLIHYNLLYNLFFKSIILTHSMRLVIN